MQFIYSKWLALPISTRHAVAERFHIRKTGPTHVIDNVVKDDGYAIGDIETALSAVDLSDTWQEMIDKAEGRVTIPVVEIKESDIAEPDMRVEAPIAEEAPKEKKSYYKTKKRENETRNKKVSSK